MPNETPTAADLRALGASVELRALAATLDLDAHRALSAAVDARKRDAAVERLTSNLVARAYSRQRDALIAAANLAAALDAVDESARAVERDLGATSRDLERACVVDDAAANAVAHCLAEILPALSNAERLDAIGGDLALAVGDDDARASASAILRALADAIQPRA